MAVGIAERIRALATTKYVRAAVASGRNEFSIRVRDVIGDLTGEGLGLGHTPQICSALRTSKFLRENGLEITNVEGPQSKMSPTVVFHYRIAHPGGSAANGGNSSGNTSPLDEAEDPAAKAFRLTEKLRGLLKEELAEYGGGEAFLRWVRGYDEEDAA